MQNSFIVVRFCTHPADPEVAAVAARQEGMISTAQLLAAGLGRGGDLAAGPPRPAAPLSPRRVLGWPHASDCARRGCGRRCWHAAGPRRRCSASARAAAPWDLMPMPSGRIDVISLRQSHSTKAIRVHRAKLDARGLHRHRRPPAHHADPHHHRPRRPAHPAPPRARPAPRRDPPDPGRRRHPRPTRRPTRPPFPNPPAGARVPRSRADSHPQRARGTLPRVRGRVRTAAPAQSTRSWKAKRSTSTGPTTA